MVKVVALSDIITPIYTGGVKETKAQSLDTEDMDSIDMFLGFMEGYLRRISPILADIFVNEQTRKFIEGLAEIAKAEFDNKPIVWPCTKGNKICIAPLAPQFIRYVDSPSEKYPAFSDYELNRWDISLTAGQPAYLLGPDYALHTDASMGRILFGIFKDGIVEIGTTPKIRQVRVTTDRDPNPGPIWLEPVQDIPVDVYKRIYVYPLPFHIPILLGVKYTLKVLPVYSGPSKLILLGVAFYEANFAEDLKWIGTTSTSGY